MTDPEIQVEAMRLAKKAVRDIKVAAWDHGWWMDDRAVQSLLLSLDLPGLLRQRERMDWALAFADRLLFHAHKGSAISDCNFEAWSQIRDAALPPTSPATAQDTWERTLLGGFGGYQSIAESKAPALLSDFSNIHYPCPSCGRRTATWFTEVNRFICCWPCGWAGGAVSATAPEQLTPTATAPEKCPKCGGSGGYWENGAVMDGYVKCDCLAAAPEQPDTATLAATVERLRAENAELQHQREQITDVLAYNDEASIDQIIEAIEHYRSEARNYPELQLKLSDVRAENAELRQRADGCPCRHTTPCSPNCTCVNRASSHGCSRCCRYGSPEQQRAQAERLVGRAETDVGWMRPRIAGLEAELDAVRAELAEVKNRPQVSTS